MNRAIFALVLGVAASCAGGCVERTARITTRPTAAIVTVNDEEIGLTPARFAFLWYGDYDIIVRKEGFETLKTHYCVPAPWWQFPPFDFVSEVLWPGTIRDEHELPTFELKPLEPPAVSDVVERATELRDRTLFESGE